MGLTGVIYAAIVIAWAIFLVPLALRRHDQTARNRSIERFSSTMRVLSAGGRSGSSRLVLSPKRGSDRVLPAASTSSVSGKPTGPDRAGSSAVSEESRPAARAAMRAAAARRRQVLRVLVGLTLVAAAVWLLGLLPAWSVLVPVVCVVAFLVLARRQVRRANEAYWERASAKRPAATNVVRRSYAARVDASHGAARVSPSPKADDEPAGVDEEDERAAGLDEGTESEEGRHPADDEPTITLTAAQLAAGAAAAEQERAVAVALKTADGGSLWDPLPITLPTYVSKTVAKRSVRNIALGEAGTWSSGHSVSASSATGAGAEDPGKSAEHDDDNEADLSQDTQRAANA